MPHVRFSVAAPRIAVVNDMPENMANQLNMLEALTPQEREDLAQTLARVLDTIGSR